MLGSPCSAATPAYDVQQACGTGLETAILVANKIALGQIESGIAGGVDTTSDAPIAVNEDLRQVLLEANRAKSLARPHQGCSAGIRPEPARAVDPAQLRAAHRPVDGRAPGDHRPQEWGITREAQDELAVGQPPATWPPPTTAASSTTWSRRSSA